MQHVAAYSWAESVGALKGGRVFVSFSSRASVAPLFEGVSLPSSAGAAEGLEKGLGGFKRPEKKKNLGGPAAESRPARDQAAPCVF